MSRKGCIGILLLVIACMITSPAVASDDQPERLQQTSTINLEINVPPMVAKLYEQIGDPDTPYRYSTPFGWGTGTRRFGTESYDFVWIAWINSDMYLQFQFSTAMGDDEMRGICEVTDNLNRQWECRYNPLDNTTWIGTSNDAGLSMTPQHQWLEATVTRFNDLSFIENMRTVHFLY